MTAQLPHSLEAEETVLGAILLSPAKLVEAAAYVSPADFYHPQYAAVFEAMQELANKQRPIDCVTVAEEVKANERNQPDLLRLFEGYVVSNVDYHAKTIRAKAERRRAILALRELAALGMSEIVDEATWREELAGGVLKLLTPPAEKREAILKTVLREVVATVEKRYESRNEVTGIPTGYPEIDGLLAGLQPGELVIVAGRPSMGKSALAFNAVTNAALKASVSALVFSLEMSRTSVGERMISGDGSIDGMRLRSGRLQTADWLALNRSASKLAPLPVTIDDSGTLTIADVRARARRWAVSNTGRRLVVVDYLQLLAGEQKKGGNREQEISSISRGLKQLAKELEAPVIALSQLNRSVESRSDRRPALSDLRESGSLEQDADVVAFVHRDEYYCEDCKNRRNCTEGHAGIADVIIAKQRNGPTGTVKLKWESRFSRFDNREGIS
jgi:replicative DNA helicase